MEELLRNYVRHLELERSISPYTVRNYSRDVQGFLDFLKQNRIDSLDKADRSTLRRYLGWLNKKGVARASINRKASALRSFYRYLIRENLVSDEPLATLSAPKLEKRLPTFLTHEEMAKLIEAPDTSTPQGLRDRAILELLYAAGLRVSEIVALDLNDIELSSREIRVWGKGSKQRVVLMGTPAAEALNIYIKRGRIKLKGKTQTRALFLNRFGNRIVQRRIQRIIRKYARQAGLELRVFPHIVRHTFATHMLDGGADLRVVQDLLGHARLSSTQVYTHVTRSQIRRNYLAAHPRSGSQKGAQ
ncbi:MAG: tyrosine recombinase XerC [Dehalococcoidia bacterium]|nr:MAG: tyrosine recombinase XerC [Dehalococcoidia bacterium]UCG83949.1 MAG: tyrosine recombinase XerC [Dehalococcoidia bacterium]